MLSEAAKKEILWAGVSDCRKRSWGKEPTFQEKRKRRFRQPKGGKRIPSGIETPGGVQIAKDERRRGKDRVQTKREKRPVKNRRRVM